MGRGRQGRRQQQGGRQGSRATGQQASGGDHDLTRIGPQQETQELVKAMLYRVTKSIEATVAASLDQLLGY